jgi:transcription initiation factor TFIIB
MQSPFPPLACSVCLTRQPLISDPESGEVICSNCGTVISDSADDNIHVERRIFTADQVNKRARTGAPSSLAIHDMGLSTIIGRENKDARGQGLDSATSFAIMRLRRWDVRTQMHSSADRNLRIAFQQLNTLKDKLGLSNAVIEKTAYIYRKAYEKGLARGKTISGMLTASVYIACREMAIPRTLKDIAIISNVKRKDIARNYRLLLLELNIKIPIVDPLNCIIRISNRVRISNKTKSKAIRTMNSIAKDKLIISAGKNPMGFAASLIYLKSDSSRDDVTQMQLAEAAGVTEVTIRNICKFLRDYVSSD